VERVVSMLNALIWDQVPVLKRFILFLIIFGIILTFIFTAPSSWYLVVPPRPYWR
jgi:small-conductance mechanosensitive channel